MGLTQLNSQKQYQKHLLHVLNKDLQIVNSEEINATESTNGHRVAEQYVKDIKNYIDVQMQDMKSFIYQLEKT